MPLPVVSGARAVRALERDGWVVARRRGSHIILKKPGSFHTLSVPDHDELDPGTLRALIRQAGLTVDQFSALLE
ncbi:MAG: type II toxin-antitoxin system HicA family toxin [Candidatus Methylomirabilia bacterium]